MGRARHVRLSTGPPLGPSREPATPTMHGPTWPARSNRREERPGTRVPRQSAARNATTTWSRDGRRASAGRVVHPDQRHIADRCARDAPRKFLCPLSTLADLGSHRNTICVPGFSQVCQLECRVGPISARVGPMTQRWRKPVLAWPHGTRPGLRCVSTGSCASQSGPRRAVHQVGPRGAQVRFATAAGSRPGDQCWRIGQPQTPKSPLDRGFSVPRRPQ